jgi:hypothetical protein
MKVGRQAAFETVRERVGERILDHLRVDEAEVGDRGAGAVDRELGAQRAPERLHPRLRSRIGAVHDAVEERVHGSDQHELATALDDLRQRCPRGSPHAEQVDVDDALPVLDRHRAGCGRTLRRDAGVRYRDVDAAEALDRRRHRILDLLAVAHVGVDPDRPLADLGGRLHRHLPVDVDDGHRGAPRVHLPSRLEADAAAGAGDEHDLPAQGVAGHDREPIRLTQRPLRETGLGRALAP